MAANRKRPIGEDPAVVYATYEEYLDSHISHDDMKFLGERELARTLLEVGYRASELLSRKEFYDRKKELTDAPKKVLDPSEILVHLGCNFEQSMFLSALADREELVRNGRLSSIIFIRDVDSRGHEISGYIDFGHRLQSEDFGQYFQGKKKLLPKPSDLSYYNWETQTLSFNNSQNFTVIADGTQGLMFKHKRDRKVVTVDPKYPPGDNSRRVVIPTPEFVQVVIFDHVTRRKN
jgi:hypothetical protein